MLGSSGPGGLEFVAQLLKGGSFTQVRELGGYYFDVNFIGEESPGLGLEFLERWWKRSVSQELQEVSKVGKAMESNPVKFVVVYKAHFCEIFCQSFW